MKKEYDLISIIVPVFNGEKYVSCCLDNILNQTYKNTEIVIVNDGSTDSTKNIIEKYAEEYSNIKIINQENKGLWSARNVGIENADGQFIGFVDVDDYIRPDMYEILHELCINNESDIAVCDRYRNINYKNDYENMNTTTEKKYIYDSRDAVIHLFSNTRNIKPALWDKLYRREMFEKIRCENTFFEDMSITYKLLYSASKVIVTKKQLYGYSVHEGSLITSEWSLKKTKSYYDIMEMIEEYFMGVDDQEIHASIQYLRMQWGIESWEYMWNSSIISDEEKTIFVKYIRKYEKEIDWKHLNAPVLKKIKKKIEYYFFARSPYNFVKIKKAFNG